MKSFSRTFIATMLVLPIASGQSNYIKKKRAKNKLWIKSNLNVLCPSIKDITVCATEVARVHCEEDWDSSITTFEASARAVFGVMTNSTYKNFKVYENGTLVTDVKYCTDEEDKKFKKRVNVRGDWRDMLDEYEKPEDEFEKEDEFEEEDEFEAEAEDDGLGDSARRLRVREVEVNDEMLPLSTPHSSGRFLNSAFCKACMCCDSWGGRRRDLRTRRALQKWEKLKTEQYYKDFLEYQCDTFNFATTFAEAYSDGFTKLVNDKGSDAVPKCFEMKNYTLKIDKINFNITLTNTSRDDPKWEVSSSNVFRQRRKRRKRWIKNNLNGLCHEVKDITVCAKDVSDQFCPNNWISSVKAFEASARIVLDDITNNTHDKFTVYENGVKKSYDLYSVDKITSIKSLIFYDPSDSRRLLGNGEVSPLSTPQSIRRHTRDINEMCSACGDCCGRLCVSSYSTGDKLTGEKRRKWKKIKNTHYLGYLKRACNKVEFAKTYANAFTQILNIDINEFADSDCFKYHNYNLTVGDESFGVNVINGPVYETVPIVDTGS